MDTRRRSWVKSLTWRLLGIGLLGLISLDLEIVRQKLKALGYID